MARKIKLHPLFLIVGIFAVIFGKGVFFLSCVLAALIHEFGHIAMAKYLKVPTDTITLMPYGAVVNSNIGFLNHTENVKIALAGPLINLIFAVLVTAFWWIFPVLYPYTSAIVTINMSIGIVNLLPCYPLDGGRIFTGLISLKYKTKTAVTIGRVLGIVLGTVFIVLFIISCFISINLSLLFMGAFIIVGAVKELKDFHIGTGFSGLLKKKDCHEMYILKQIVVNENESLYKLAGYLDNKYYCKFIVIGDSFNVICEFSENDFIEYINKYDAYFTIKEVQSKCSTR